MAQYSLLLVGALLASAFPLRAAAQETPRAPALTATGGVTLASQYRFRGIGLSDEKPALQGTINLNHESGAYVGAWASSLDGFGELGGSNLELDLYGGYRTELAKGVTADAGLLYYAYPGSRGGKFEFFEPYANVSGKLGPVTAKVGAAFAPAQSAIGGNSNLYLFNDNSLPIAGTPIALASHVGWSKGRTTLTPGGDYLDWSLGAQATWRNLTAGVSYVDTDIGRRDALAAGATKEIVDGAVVLSLGASF
ncbi:TorF family putative porin [Sphingomonas rosea]|uniref:TorF family putative porin n=1 Tax=Sphingomonas rosea TaxID=335605 RepID=A0ABP7U7Y7_9SPHN